MVSFGIEILRRDGHRWLNDHRLGLLCNQASTDRQFNHSRDIIDSSYPGKLTTLLSPQHGFFSDQQDNMIESDHITDTSTGLPVYSLYGETRKPTKEMFDNIEVLLIDIQDVGTRVYTFIYTMAYCLEMAAKSGKKVIVLDRPNPIGGQQIEGNILKDELKSFVGLYPIPMRHGMTVGELALMFNDHFGIGAELDVVKTEGWKRHMYYRDTGLPWIYPSPNMPTPETAIVYPGQVIWEGTNISEGRGTCLPFELFGAPFIEPNGFLNTLDEGDLSGCFLRPIVFEPTSNKFAGELCNGFHLQIIDKALYCPYLTSMAILQALLKSYPDQFLYKKPPYEYEYEKLPLDMIIGDTKIRQQLESGISINSLRNEWQPGLDEFESLRHDYFLY